MRIWDISPAYLNRNSLLGEHRELHGMVSIFVNNKKGYSRHPETLRWVGREWALAMRHRQIVEEMKLRGYTDRSPVSLDNNMNKWPDTYIDTPDIQYEILRKKYVGKEGGRVPLPKNATQLWAQHKYSIMARSVVLYKEIGRFLSKPCSEEGYSELCLKLVNELREVPSEKGIRNALFHMWGYVAKTSAIEGRRVNEMGARELFEEIGNSVMREKRGYLYTSVSLSELGVWI